jgi:hypothetical protein
LAHDVFISNEGNTQMTIQQINQMTNEYTVERHACSSSLYFIRSNRDGRIIDSAMSLKWATEWMRAKVGA